MLTFRTVPMWCEWRTPRLAFVLRYRHVNAVTAVRTGRQHLPVRRKNTIRQFKERRHVRPVFEHVVALSHRTGFGPALRSLHSKLKTGLLVFSCLDPTQIDLAAGSDAQIGLPAALRSGSHNFGYGTESIGIP